VTDNGCNRVLGFHNALTLGGSPPADVVLGQASFITSTSSCSQNGFGNPRGIFVDPSTVALLISDFDFNRVLVYSRGSIATGVNAALVLGQPDFVTCTPRITDATTLNDAGGIWYDAGFNLYVAQLGENRVTRLNCPTGLPISTASPTSSLSISVSNSFGSLSSSGSVTVSITLSSSVSVTVSVTQSLTPSPTQTPTPSSSVTQPFVCGNGILEGPELCDPGFGNFGGVSCCNNRCHFKRKGARCGPRVACKTVRRCSGRGVNPGVCLSSKNKKTGVSCHLASSPTGLGTCDRGVCS